MGLRFIVFSLPHSGSTFPCLPETAGLVAPPPPPPHCCCCWAAAAAAWCCGCELPVSAGLLLAMLRRKEGGREKGGGGGQARSRSSGQRSGTLLHGTPSGQGAASLSPSWMREGNGNADKRTLDRKQTPRRGRENSRQKANRRPPSAISSANCPWEQDGGPGGCYVTRPRVPS